MADTVRGVEYYYVTVRDAPGEGQRILSALKGSGVNLLAYLGFPLGGGQSQIDLVPEDPDALKEAAERAGIALSEAKRAFLIQGDDRGRLPSMWRSPPHPPHPPHRGANPHRMRGRGSLEFDNRLRHMAPQFDGVG